MRASATMLLTLLLAAPFGAWSPNLCPVVHDQGQSTPSRPFVELEKTRFASTEQVFFWVGVTAPGDYRIPQNLWNTCRLIVTRPDGTEKTTVASWPTDGVLDRGWRGGWGLGSEQLQLGRYVVVFEFAGQQTDPASFVVEDVPVLKDVRGEFVFPSPFALEASDRVTLIIHNGSGETIRFPYRGEMNESVYVQLTSNRLRSTFFVPQAVLLSAAGANQSSIENTLNWDLAANVSIVTLAPGGTYRLELPLSAVLTAAAEGSSPIPLPRGEYDVRFSTVIQVLIGERNGPWADLGPSRLNITSVAHATLN